jgi:hypothetical protein
VPKPRVLRSTETREFEARERVSDALPSVCDAAQRCLRFVFCWTLSVADRFDDEAGASAVASEDRASAAACASGSS